MDYELRTDGDGGDCELPWATPSSICYGEHLTGATTGVAKSFNRSRKKLQPRVVLKELQWGGAKCAMHRGCWNQQKNCWNRRREVLRPWQQNVGTNSGVLQQVLFFASTSFCFSWNHQTFLLEPVISMDTSMEAFFAFAGTSDNFLLQPAIVYAGTIIYFCWRQHFSEMCFFFLFAGIDLLS